MKWIFTNIQIVGKFMRVVKRINVSGGNGTAFLVVLVFLFVGMVFLGMSVAFTINEIKKSERCSEETTAVVVEIKSKLSTTKDSDGHSHTTTVYSPVFMYTVNGEWITAGNDTYSNPCSFRVGQQVELNYNPNDPTEFFCKSDNTMFILRLVFGILGGVFVLVSVIMISVAVTSIRKAKSAPIEQYYEDYSNKPMQ